MIPIVKRPAAVCFEQAAVLLVLYAIECRPHPEKDSDPYGPQIEKEAPAAKTIYNPSAVELAGETGREGNTAKLNGPYYPQAQT
ncbi:MAG: hypothetical protein JW829_07445 [Pirellulales bacterium]|nr:hypothetical protein [Pirellulales bacterium]